MTALDAIGELHELETADGNKLILPGGDIAFLAYGGYGAPQTNFITRRGYKQHGATEVDYLLESRSVSVTLWQNRACSRQEYWDNRFALHEFLRPNRGGQLKLTLRQPSGELRSLYVRANSGLSFPSPADNSWFINEPLEFIAFDPIWFDPATTSSAVPGITADELVFPITFDDTNIIFGESGLLFESVITYTGSWQTFPIITLTGPYTSATIRHVERDLIITLNVPIAAGQTRILDLTPGNQSLIDGSGTNHFGDLGPLTNLVNFSLLPDPEVTGGINTIRITLFSAIAGLSTATVAYNTRYFAL